MNYEGKCYKQVLTLLTASNAEANCVSLGGHLTSILDLGEHEQVHNSYCLYVSHTQLLSRCTESCLMVLTRGLGDRSQAEVGSG